MPLALSVVVAFAAMACGSSVAIVPGDGGDAAAGDGGSRSEAATEAGPDAPGDARAVCPAAVPRSGDPCVAPLTCAYAQPGSPPLCRTIAACNGHWQVLEPDPTCGLHLGCPDTFAMVVEGSSCPANTGFCDYLEGRCGCAPCGTPPDTVEARRWTCRRWNTGGDGCPPSSPLAGSPCDLPGQFCTYGGACSTIAVGDNLKCANGTWEAVPSVLGSCILQSCSKP